MRNLPNLIFRLQHVFNSLATADKMFREITFTLIYVSNTSRLNEEIRGATLHEILVARYFVHSCQNVNNN